MNACINGVTIRCRDLKASAHFYEDLLGFRRGQQLGTMLELFGDTGPWPALVDPPPPSRITVMLDQVDEVAARAVDDVYGVVIGLTVDDVDASVDRLRSAGRGVRFEARDETYGVRNAAVYDPDGHEVWLSGPLKGS